MKNYLFFPILLCVLACSCGHQEPKNQTVNPTDTIVLESNELTMQLGTSLKVDIVYNTAENVKWTSSDSTIATVSKAGIITAHKVGDVTIYVSGNEFNIASDSVSITIVPIDEAEYIPPVLFDWGATSAQIDDFLRHTYPEENIIKDGNEYIGAYTANSFTMYITLSGADETMLTNAVMYVWGDPDSIENILHQRYIVGENSYIEPNTRSFVQYRYVGAGKNEINHQSVKHDFYYITYDPYYFEFEDGTLQVTKVNDKEYITILTSYGYVLYPSDFVGDTFPLVYRGKSYNLSDEVVAFGYDRSVPDENGVYLMDLLGMIRQ